MSINTYTKFILDVDGVLNDGVIYWGADGKPFKAFGNYDPDGLKFLRDFIDIEFISADKAGWDITESRIKHMGFNVTLVTEKERMGWVLSRNNPIETVYMADGPHDADILKVVGLGIVPANAYKTATRSADYVSPYRGGHGAVMDACVYIMDKMGIKHGF